MHIDRLAGTRRQAVMGHKALFAVCGLLWCVLGTGGQGYIPFLAGRPCRASLLFLSIWSSHTRPQTRQARR